MSKNPIEIIGGGVAGLSLAHGLAQRGVRVRVCEALTYPRHRLCGEFINGVSDETLNCLGIGKIFTDAQQHQEMTWWRGSTKFLDRRLESPVRALSRWQMGRRLVEAVRDAGGEVQERSRIGQIDKVSEGRVWAAGRKATRGSQWLGLKAHFLGVEMSEGLEMHLGEGGYVGLTPVEEGRINVCGLFKKRSQMGGKGPRVLLNYLRACELSELANRLAEAGPDETSVCGVSGIHFGNQGQDDELVTIGDAERMIPPFTGNGMSMALEAAECALEPLQQFSLGESSWNEVRAEISKRVANRFRLRMRAALRLQPLLTHPGGQHLLKGLARPGLLPVHFLHQLLT